ncbi:hypothetical protein [Sphingomonas abietis]|uniref:General stress protein 17M-like domain-containing protein n=1 Tax=Sphingomonas abietis TaxID=3012344 RepID=A0ABY7NTH3_9SPHN|nr:hypothetical protein [Sphingomonas abietis]WBO24437.1 hypothetical protein PBT88_10205 [Sphingomonas abietis]
MTQTITRLFDSYPDATSAVRALEAAGTSHDDISVIANNADGTHAERANDGVDTHDGVNDHGDVTRGTSTGAVLGGAGGLLAGLGLLAIPGLGPIVAAGWLAATAAGAGIGAVGGAATGGIVGALKNAGHSDEDAHVYSEGVRRGGTLVSVRAPEDRRAAIEAIFDQNGSVDAASRGQAYRGSGWNGFDAEAPAYDASQVQGERALYARDTTRV